MLLIVSLPCLKDIRHMANHMQTALTNKRLLIKSVYSLHNTGWISEQFPLQVVILLRHPCAIVHIIYRCWPDARLKNPHEQENILADHLQPHLE